MTLSAETMPWLKTQNEQLPLFMEKLQVSNQPGRFLPCCDGLTEAGKKASLGFSCFAFKIYYTANLWKTVSNEDQKAWLDFMCDFQVESDIHGSTIGQGAFIDPGLLDAISALKEPWKVRLGRWIGGGHSPRDMAIAAETKQAIATLAETDQKPRQPFRGFPQSQDQVFKTLKAFDWSQPWKAGGRASAVVVFIQTQAPLLFNEVKSMELTQVCRDFMNALVDSESGAYFRGDVSSHGQLVNGAMKVLTAMDWLDLPVHYPEKLIDTCLRQAPAKTGCNLVDVIYVLHRCRMQTNHRLKEIQSYCGDVLQIIQLHYHNEGGFSYKVGASQTHYYGAEITKGFNLADIHGTCLLSWAVAMILEILEEDCLGWQVIRP